MRDANIAGGIYMDLRTTKKEIEESKRFNYAYKEKFKCVACGKEVEFSHIEPMERVFCDKCKKEHIESHKKLVERYAKIKLQVMHENALREMEKSCKCYMNDMLDSIDFVRQMEIESPESFFSISEIITAIILVDNDIRFKINHKILNYKIDFFIPDMHICLEVDGGFHDFRLAKDGKRDIEIRKELGEKWETIRIPTKLVMENPNKIVDAMKLMYKETKKIRNLNNGIIPSAYSRTAKAYYKEAGLEE